MFPDVAAQSYELMSARCRFEFAAMATRSLLAVVIAVTLPKTLDGGAIRQAPRDPLTTQPYEYTVIDADRYELCAVFQQAWEDGPVFWRHG